MLADLRFVFDTNVLVSALLLKTSVPRQAFDRARAHGRFMISWPTLAELHEVLSRPRFDKYVYEDERLQFLAAFVRDAVLVEIVEMVTDCRDPKDNKFLEVAVNGHATVLVSGDDDLLTLHPFRGIPVLTPQAFLHFPM